MSAKKYKVEVYTYDMVGVVEETNDPKRLGRVKVRIERLHGRLDDTNFIPTVDLPWCDITVRGGRFGYPSNGKVVAVTFENDDYYKPSISDILHYDVNLQDKLNSLDDEHYDKFYANSYNADHQYYHDMDDGIMFDYVKSNINLRPNGDIRVNLRDNNSKLYLGTEDADQQAILGNHWMDLFDELVQNLLGSKGGPYLGNMGAPVIPNPGMLEWCNKYLAIRETLLSDHVFIVDDNRVKPQTRPFDIQQSGDNWNNENFEKVNTPRTEGYQPEDRSITGGNPEGVPPTTYSDNLASSTLPDDATDTEKLREVKPFEGEAGNGEIPLENMTISTKLQESFSDSEDERKYLLDEPSKSFDTWITSYDSEKTSDWGNIIATKGYHNKERQTNSRKQYPTKAPLEGKDPFGNGNQVEIYFGVNKNNKDVTDRVKSYLKRGVIDETLERSVEVEALDWLITNGRKNKWKLAGRTATGDQQWWHWIYDASLSPNAPIVETEPPVVVKTKTENPTTVDYNYYGSDSPYTKSSPKTITMDLDQSKGEWKYILVSFDYSLDGEDGSDVSYDMSIKSNGKKVIIDMDDVIEGELDLLPIDFSESHLKLKFRVIADPIVNGKLDSTRKQVVKIINSEIIVRK